MTSLVEIQAVATVERGRFVPAAHLKNMRNGYVPYIRPSDFTNAHNLAAELGLPKEDLVHHRLNLLPQGTTLIVPHYGRLGDLFPKAILLTTEATTNQNVFSIIPNLKHCHPKYLCYAIQYEIECLIDDLGFSSELSTRTLCEMEIPLPSLPEQAEIVDILDAATQIVDLRQRQLVMLGELIRSTFRSMFGNTAVQTTKPLDACTELYLPRPLGKQDEETDDSEEEETLPLVTPGDIHGTWIRQTRRTITEQEVSQSNLRALPEKSIVIITRGARSGLPGILSFPAVIAPNCIALPPSTEYVPEFLFYHLMSNLSGIQKLQEGAAMQMLPTRALRELPVPIVPPENQRRFADFAGDVEEQWQLIDRSRLNSETLFDRLLDDIFA